MRFFFIICICFLCLPGYGKKILTMKHPDNCYVWKSIVTENHVFVLRSDSTKEGDLFLTMFSPELEKEAEWRVPKEPGVNGPAYDFWISPGMDGHYMGMVFCSPGEINDSLSDASYFIHISPDKKGSLVKAGLNPLYRGHNSFFARRDTLFLFRELTYRDKKSKREKFEHRFFLHYFLPAENFKRETIRLELDDELIPNSIYFQWELKSHKNDTLIFSRRFYLNDENILIFKVRYLTRTGKLIKELTLRFKPQSILRGHKNYDTNPQVFQNGLVYFQSVGDVFYDEDREQFLVYGLTGKGKYREKLTNYTGYFICAFNKKGYKLSYKEEVIPEEFQKFNYRSLGDLVSRKFAVRTTPDGYKLQLMYGSSMVTWNLSADGSILNRSYFSFNKDFDETTANIMSSASYDLLQIFNKYRKENSVKGSRFYYGKFKSTEYLLVVDFKKKETVIIY